VWFPPKPHRCGFGVSNKLDFVRKFTNSESTNNRVFKEKIVGRFYTGIWSGDCFNYFKNVTKMPALTLSLKWDIDGFLAMGRCLFPWNVSSTSPSLCPEPRGHITGTGNHTPGGSESDDLPACREEKTLSQSFSILNLCCPRHPE
jgi:hypothetical protein